MSTSPPNYDFEGDPLLEAYMNAKFSEEISEKMKVPKRSKLHIKKIDLNTPFISTINCNTVMFLKLLSYYVIYIPICF